MSKLRLTLACGDYDFLSPLFDGTVKPAGVDLNVLTMPSPERHGRMLRHEEFDVCELSLVGYLVARDRGSNYNAIPVRRTRMPTRAQAVFCSLSIPLLSMKSSSEAAYSSDRGAGFPDSRRQVRSDARELR